MINMNYSKYFNAIEEHNVYFLRVPKDVIPPKVNDVLLINEQKFKVKYLSTPEDIMKGRGGPVGKSMIENGIGWDVQLEKLGDNMKHIAKIQTEFLKAAANWDNMSLDEQKAYLQRHPGSKRQLTAKPEETKVDNSRNPEETKRLQNRKKKYLQKLKLHGVNVTDDNPEETKKRLQNRKKNYLKKLKLYGLN